MESEYDFNAVMYRPCNEDDLSKNGGYLHPAEKSKLYITKNNVSITLDEEEIKKLVRCIGASFK